jgi:hypothetical protein
VANVEFEVTTAAAKMSVLIGCVGVQTGQS